MEFYKEKKKAYVDIDEMLKEGTNIDIIIYKISTRYGFGKKFVTDRIEQIKKLGLSNEPKYQE